jgi:hypothetical protein
MQANYTVEQVPENIREGIRERLNKLYEQAKKGGQDDNIG